MQSTYDDHCYAVVFTRYVTAIYIIIIIINIYIALFFEVTQNTALHVVSLLRRLVSRHCETFYCHDIYECVCSMCPCSDQLTTTSTEDLSRRLTK